MNQRLARFFEQSENRPDYRQKVLQAEVSADLRILIAQSGKNFKEIASAIGISPAALSKKLGGKVNLTLDSIMAIAQAAGADVDIIFRPQGTLRALQHWQTLEQARTILKDADALFQEVKMTSKRIQAMHETAEMISREAFRRQEIGSFRFTSYPAANDEPANGTLAASCG